MPTVLQKVQLGLFHLKDKEVGRQAFWAALPLVIFTTETHVMGSGNVLAFMLQNHLVGHFAK